MKYQRLSKFRRGALLTGAVLVFVSMVTVVSLGGCGGGGNSSSSDGNPSSCGNQPSITIDVPSSVGAGSISGRTCNADTSKDKVVLFALTNQWYVQPFTYAPFTDIASDGTWMSPTHPWSFIVALLVDPTSYTPADTEITNPALDANVLAWAMYPDSPVSLKFSNYTWGIKMTGNDTADAFDPGPNVWSNDPSVVSVGADGLHLNIVKINGVWNCPEVYLLKSLGYGTYTMRVGTALDDLDLDTVAAPLFIYAQPSQELDNEYSGMNGLIPAPDNAQFVVQPYTVSGNMVRYVQPPNTDQFTMQIDWRQDHVTFMSWKGWATTPEAADIIDQWNYTGTYIPPPGQERVHINLWLLNGQPPVSGNGDSLVINSFTYQP